ncbi:MAG: hypothetical protein ABSA12_17125 [Verrucomicrobiia bacterium]
MPQRIGAASRPTRLRGKGNKDTEIALAKLLRANGITGWRRQQRVRVGGGKTACSLRSPHLNPLPQGARRRKAESKERRSRRDRPTTVRVDFIFRRERVVVFVDGCFWHGCPVHSSPARWLKRSTMGKGRATDAPFDQAQGRHGWTRIFTTKSTLRLRSGQAKGAGRTGKAFWARKMAGNMARDRFVTRTLRRQGWKVIRIWEHELARSPGGCLERIRRVLG